MLNSSIVAPPEIVNARNKFRYDINALRAFAVLGVVAFHFGINGITGGFSGVDVFFVISGFLISSQILDGYNRGEFSYLKFYNSRLRRIFPALFVVTVVCLVWGWFYYLPKFYINTNRHAVSALFFVSNYAFDGERGYFDAAAHTKALLHTWSLSVEGQFYLFLPVFIGLSFRFAKRHLLVLMGIAFLGFFAWSVYVSLTSPGKGFYFLSCRAWEFLAGTIMAVVRHKKLNATTTNILSVLSIIVLIASFTLIDSSMAWPGLWTLMPVISTAILIGIGEASYTRSFLALWPIQKIGDISYSLYLWHWPVLIFSTGIASMSGQNLSALDTFWMFIVSLIFASLSWKYIEQPVRLNKVWWTQKRVFIGTGVAAVISFSFGLMVVATHGAPVRLPSYVQRASEAIFVNTPRDECFRNGDSTKKAKEQFCTLGSTQSDKPVLALWGDSHANQYAAAVSDAASAVGVSGIIATQTGCPPMKILDNKSNASGCERFNKEVYNYLSDNSSIRTVILGKWWGSTDVDQTLELARDLVSHGKSVILIGALPVPGFDVPERWSLQQIKQGNPIDLMLSPLASQTLALTNRDKVTSGLSSQINEGKLIYIDPLKRLCDDVSCRLVDEGHSNFRDDSHLSNSTATNAFKQDFVEALNKFKRSN